jgi:predicted nucleic acid-binding protein
MGLILDSSIVIEAERRGNNVVQLLKRVSATTGDQRSVLSAIGLTELIHGVYRAQTAVIRAAREAFIRDLLDALEVYPFTKTTAVLAGKIDGEQQSRGVVIPISRSIDWCDRSRRWLLGPHGECAAFSNGAWPGGDPALAAGPQVRKRPEFSAFAESGKDGERPEEGDGAGEGAGGVEALSGAARGENSEA